MKKNFILFALMVFLPVLAFAQALSVTLGGNGVETTYDGNAKTLTVTRNGSTYSKATGKGYQNRTYRIYKGSYSDQGPNTEVSEIKNAGTYTVRGKGMSQNYYTATVTVNRKDIADESVTVTPDPIAKQPFAGKAIEPEFALNDGQTELTGAKYVSGQNPAAGVDYTYDFMNNTQVGTAKISIYGFGNYKGSREVEFSIYNPSENPSIFGKTVNFTFDGTPTYNGSEWYPATISIEGIGTLTKADRRGIPAYSGTDNFAVVSVVNNINAGLATVTLEGTGDYEGQAQGTFPIAQQPLTGATITLAASSVEYNGTSTAVGINSVKDADGKTLVAGVDYLVYGYKYNSTTAVTEAVPGHVGNWYVVVGPAAGSNYTAEAVSANSFEVTKRALKIDLLEIHKTYGDADPDLANIDINTWASINWAPGDGSSNTKITQNDGTAIKIERLTVGENVYDEAGNRNSFAYSLKNPTQLKATTTINGVNYVNYTVGVGQSSNLLIDKAPLTISIANNTKNYLDADPASFNVVTTGANAPVGLKRGESIADAKLEISRVAGENAGNYAFKANPINNYEVTFRNDFIINPLDLSGIEFTFVGGTAQQYAGVQLKPTPIVTFTKNGKTYTLGNADYEITGYGTNLNVNDANIYVEITGKGNYGKTGNNVTHVKKLPFTITKAPLTIGVVPQEFNTGDTPNDNDYEFEYTKNGFVGNDATTFPTTAYFTKPTGIEILPTSITGVFELKPNHDATAVNYEISYNDKNLRTFGVKQLFIAANDKTQVYGDAAIALTTDDVTITGFPANMTQTQKDQVLKPAGQCVYTVTRDESQKNAGKYPITVSGVQAVEGYYITYRPGTYTITKRPVTLVAEDIEKTYGEVDPGFKVSVKNIVAGDNLEDVLVYTWTDRWGRTHSENVYSISRENGETARPKANPNNNYYQITVSLNNYASQIQNYQFGGNYNGTNYAATQNGKFNINKKNLTIYPNDVTKTYGTYTTETAENGLLNVTVEGLVNYTWPQIFFQGMPNIQDTEASVLGTGNNTFYVLTRDHGPKNQYGAWTQYRVYENVKDGGYAITIANRVATATLTNYNVIYTPNKATLTIEPKTINVTAKDQGLGYDKEIDKYAVAIDTYTGDVTGSTVFYYDDQVQEVLYLTKSVTSVGVHAKDTNPYTLNKVTPKSNNYVINFTQGNLTINGLKTIPLGKADLAAITNKPLKQVLEDHKNATVNVVLPSDRSMQKEDWYSWVLPFKTTVRQVSNKFGYAAIDLLDTEKSVGSKIAFKQIVSEIPANTPFLAKSDDNISATNMGKIVFENVVIAEANYLDGYVAVGNEDAYQFIGLYEPTDGLTASDLYLTRKTSVDPARAFYVGDAEAKLSQTRAYLHFASPEAAANAIIYVEENGTYTAINGVEVEDAEAAEGWYTITGVKLDAEPTTTGTYIFNGKKVFIQK